MNPTTRSPSSAYINTMKAAGMFHRIWRVTCSFIYAPSESRWRRCLVTRLLNQTIADEFNPYGGIKNRAHICRVLRSILATQPLTPSAAGRGTGFRKEDDSILD